MLTKLTKEQEGLLDKIIKEWIELITKGSISFTKESIQKDIDWLYKEAKLESPTIIVATNLAQHKKQVKDAQKKHEFKFVQQEFGLGYESWLCLYEFLEKIDYTHNDRYMKYVNLMKKGIFSAVFTDTHAFLCKLPQKIRFNDAEQLHSILHAAIQMPNGDNYYFIKGVKFDEKLWTKITKRKITPKEILKLQNMEQRYIAFEVYGPEKLMAAMNAKLIDTYKSKSANLDNSIDVELYEIPKLINDTTAVKCLKYRCHSTARPYTSFVPPEMKTAKEAMAWKFSQTPEEFGEMDIQS